MMQPDLRSKTPEAFWEEVYGKASLETSGIPSNNRGAERVISTRSALDV